jgi:hypothetical protein
MTQLDSNTTGNELDEILEPLHLATESDVCPTVVGLGDCNCDVKSAKSKLTKYTEQQVLIGRIDELEWADDKFDSLLQATEDGDRVYPGEYFEAIQDRQTTLKAQLKGK